MKKLLWVVLTLVVTAPALFAQTDLEMQLTRKIAQAQMNQQIPNEQQQAFLTKLEEIRQLVKEMTEYDASIVMQDVVRLADDFFTYVPQQAGVPATAREFQAKRGASMMTWAYFVDAPMQAGWTEESFIITQAVDDFLNKGAYSWNGEREKHELAVFSAVIKQYSPWGNSAQQEVKQDKTRSAGNTSKSYEPMLPLSTHLKR